MVKRIISSTSSEILNLTPKELKESIRASEGRVIVSENVVCRESFLGDVTNSEVARAFGADMILLNAFDVFNPFISGLETKGKNTINKLHKLIGAPIGLNLEPCDQNAKMQDQKVEIEKGRIVSKESLEEAARLGFDFVCLTGNPGTGVTNEKIAESIKAAKKYFNGLIIAGKMHSSGVKESVTSKESIETFVKAGADIILLPAVGTVPGFDSELLKRAVKIAHAYDALVMTAIGTSQEGSSKETIRQIALINKICGVDIQHIGDAGYAGLAPAENIYELSKVIRGIRHTASVMSRSINR